MDQLSLYFLKLFDISLNDLELIYIVVCLAIVCIILWLTFRFIEGFVEKSKR
jgi:hypothetical protein